MQEGDNSLGGFLVPTEFANRVLDVRNQFGLFAMYADVEPMAREEKTVPRQTGDVTVYALGENDSYTASDVTHDKVSLVARKWGVLAKMTDEVDADAAVSLAESVTRSTGWGIAKKQDEAGLLGDGTSTYHGIKGIITKANDGSHAGALYTTPTGIIAFSDLTLAHFESMCGQLAAFADEDGDAAWYCSKAAWANSMLGLQNAAGGNTMVDIGRGPEKQFLGYPVRFAHSMNSTLTDQADTAGLVVLANLGMSSTLGDRSGLDFKILNELFAADGLIGIRATVRFDIVNHSITDPKDSTGATAGAAVVMKTGAAS